jgi:hypothetical protein
MPAGPMLADLAGRLRPSNRPRNQRLTDRRFDSLVAAKRCGNQCYLLPRKRRDRRETASKK